MKILGRVRFRALLQASCAVLAGAAAATPASALAEVARPAVITIAPQPLGSALVELGRLTGREIIAPADLVRPYRSQEVRGTASVEAGLALLLRGTGLTWRMNASGTYLIERRTAAAAAPLPFEVSEVVVTGTRLQAREEIANRRQSITVVDTLSQDDTGDLADQSLAEALRRIPGVSTLYDEDEGSLVTIRGIQPDWNHVTVDGLTLASVGTGGGGRRQVDLALIPSSSSRKSEVFKTFTADLDAAAVGGVLNIVPRSAYDRRRRLFLVDVYANDFTYNAVPGDNSMGGSKDSPWGGGFNFTYADRFGASDQFGLVLTAGFQRKQRDQTNLNVPRRAYYNAAGLETTPDSPDWNGFSAPGQFVAYNLTNAIENAGGSVRFEYRPTDALYGALTLFQYTQGESETRNTNNFSALDRPLNQTAETGNLRVRDYRVAYRHHTYDRATRGAQFRTRWRPDAGSSLDFGIGYSRSSYEDLIPDVSYAYAPNLRLYYTGGAYHPRFTLDDPASYRDPSRFTLRAASLAHEDVVGELTDARLDYARNAAFEDRGWGFKAGASLRRFALRRDNTYLNYLSDGSALTGLEYAPDFTPLDWPYPVLWMNGRRFFEIKVPTLAVNSDVSARNSVAEDYKYRETIGAGYAMATFSTDRLKLAGGVRYDRSESDAYIPRTVNGVTAFAANGSGYDQLLPSASLAWLPRDDLRVKASFSQTIGRPNPRDLARPETRDDQELTITRGNPGIRPRRADNYDLAVEKYFNGSSGMMALTLFDKEVADDILVLTTQQMIDGVAYAVRQPLNAERSSERGVEFSFVNERIALPGPLKDKVGVSLNATRLWGETTYPVDGRIVTANRLPFQSDWLANAAVFYALPRGGEARIAVNYQSEYVDDFGAQSWLREGWADYLTWDLMIRHQVTDRLLIKFQARNIGDANRIGLLGRDFEFKRRELEFGRSFYLHLICKL